MGNTTSSKKGSSNFSSVVKGGNNWLVAGEDGVMATSPFDLQDAGQSPRRAKTARGNGSNSPTQAANAFKAAQNRVRTDQVVKIS